MRSDAHARLHPWCKVPILRHGEVQLFETSAITRYIDETADGPRLTPATAAARGVMDQWISVVNCYVYDSVVRNYSFVYLGAKFRGEEPDRGAAEAGVPNMKRDFSRLDEAYSRSQWIAGESLSLADLFVAPIVQTATMFPEGKATVAELPNLTRAFAAIQERKSFRAAHEGMLGS